MGEMKSVEIFGVNIKNTTLSETMDLLREKLEDDRLFTIATPNTEIVMRAKDDKDLASLINSFDLVIPDGIGLIYASKIKKLPLQERVTGYDTSIELLKLGEERPIRLFILAGKPGISQMASENVEKDYPGVNVVGHRNGYFTLEDEDSIVEEINNSKADIIFVGLGFPKQEEFIRRNRDKLIGKIIIGNGGVTDILAGASNRAPDLFIKLNLEWLYRLLKEPRRIGRQIAIPRFIFNVIIDRDSVLKGDSNE